MSACSQAELTFRLGAFEVDDGSGHVIPEHLAGLLPGHATVRHDREQHCRSLRRRVCTDDLQTQEMVKSLSDLQMITAFIADLSSQPDARLL